MLGRKGAGGINRTHLNMRKEIQTALSSLTGILQYLKLALPGIVVITEWWASEVSSARVGISLGRRTGGARSWRLL